MRSHSASGEAAITTCPSENTGAFRLAFTLPPTQTSSSQAARATDEDITLSQDYASSRADAGPPASAKGHQHP